MSKKNKNDDLTEMPTVCAYCENSCNLYSEEKMLCKIKGVVSPEYKCRKFRYDPLKRSPGHPHVDISLDVDEVEDEESDE